jgi:hypothetical protein
MVRLTVEDVVDNAHIAAWQAHETHVPDTPAKLRPAALITSHR